jgi:hypothetical protein
MVLILTHHRIFCISWSSGTVERTDANRMNKEQSNVGLYRNTICSPPSLILRILISTNRSDELPICWSPIFIDWTPELITCCVAPIKTGGVIPHENRIPTASPNVLGRGGTELPGRVEDPGRLVRDANGAWSGKFFIPKSGMDSKNHRFRDFSRFVGIEP